MNAFSAYLRQPTSIAGMSAIVGTVMGLMSGSLTWQAAVPLIVGSLVAIALPENPDAKTATVALVADAIKTAEAVTPKA